jgi:hypothetical protein
MNAFFPVSAVLPPVFSYPVLMHRAPDPAPADDPAPPAAPHAPHPVPSDDPVPDHNPSLH